MVRIKDRRGDGPTLSVILTVTIDAMLKKNSVNNGHELKSITCKLGLKAVLVFLLTTNHSLCLTDNHSITRSNTHAMCSNLINDYHCSKWEIKWKVNW